MSTGPIPGAATTTGRRRSCYLAGWGFGHATLNGKPLYQDYEMHFMVTRGSVIARR